MVAVDFFKKLEKREGASNKGKEVIPGWSESGASSCGYHTPKESPSASCGVRAYHSPSESCGSWNTSSQEVGGEMEVKEEAPFQFCAPSVSSDVAPSRASRGGRKRACPDQSPDGAGSRGRVRRCVFASLELGGLVGEMKEV